MSQNQKLNYSLEDEEHSILLVKECSRDWAMSNLLHKVFPEGTETTESCNALFWSITFPPNVSIPNRGKKTPYAKCSVGVQYHYIKHCIQSSNWFYFKNSFFVVEHNKNGSCHLHILSSAQGNHLQDMRAEIMYNFKLDYKQFDDKLNIKTRGVDDIFKAVAYFFKETLNWVSPKDYVSIDAFNESITVKTYEVSKYNLFYIE